MGNYYSKPSPEYVNRPNGPVPEIKITPPQEPNEDQSQPFEQPPNTSKPPPNNVNHPKIPVPAIEGTPPPNESVSSENKVPKQSRT
ncbi:unnamed protein product [Periconia digitata]|uniref:Uncharacterized protein n=1 Tax=Periconia digitata TaxID=1303443 RepID=A0A9W4UKY9_9PLEO|nr:unnamed protein product [Periconia digitata]